MSGAQTMQRGRFRFRVNGVEYHSDDGDLSGREVRSRAGFDPASEHVLISLGDRGATSVGLDERVMLDNDVHPDFRVFASDRVFSFTLDERGYEWGDAHIGEAELRLIAGVDHDLDIVLGGGDGATVDRGSSIRLDRPGTEGLLTRQAREVGIIVNGRPRTVPAGRITYETLVGIALDAPPGPNASVTVIYRGGPRTKPEGSLVAGGSVHVRPGMIFNVTTTDKS